MHIVDSTYYYIQKGSTGMVRERSLHTLGQEAVPHAIAATAWETAIRHMDSEAQVTRTGIRMGERDSGKEWTHRV